MAVLMVLTYMNMDIGNEKKYEGSWKKEFDNSLAFLSNVDFNLSCAILLFYVGVEYAVNGWMVTYL
ncbi:MAG TPA: hypothetical protein VK031_10220, partial [Tissierellaceae bacterium]|nr:hypothetical protein [Tissierellaceae bacterium]